MNLDRDDIETLAVFFGLLAEVEKDSNTDV